MMQHSQITRRRDVRKTCYHYHQRSRNPLQNCVIISILGRTGQSDRGGPQLLQPYIWLPTELGTDQVP